MLSVIRRNKSITSIAFLAIGLSLFLAIQYFIGGTDQSGLVQSKLNQMILSDLWYVILYVHITSSIMALGIGWLQFVGRIRVKSIRMHRMMGRIYSYGVLLGGISGFYLSFYADGGWISSLGFLTVSVLWIYTLIRGIRSITVKKNRLEHQRWMTRCYALTFAAVTLRLYLGFSVAIFGEENFNDYYRVIAWLSWVPNLIFVEWLLNRPKQKK